MGKGNSGYDIIYNTSYKVVWLAQPFCSYSRATELKAT
jgi:hypothetical protein